MLISNEDALKRLHSPGNLINKLNGSSRKNAMSLFVRPSEEVKKEEKEVKTLSFNPFEKEEKIVINPTAIIPQVKAAPEKSSSENPAVEDLIDNHDNQIKLSLAHDSALKVLTDSVAMLATKLDDIKPDKLPSVITATSKVVESIRRERNEAAKSGKDKEVHFHFYTPQQKMLSDFEVIDVA